MISKHSMSVLMCSVMLSTTRYRLFLTFQSPMQCFCYFFNNYILEK
uniref:Uncharacterized protein n=1 Tax=Arundo donax TaxID=35708 RepID=A0A0A8Z472_ARUDO